VKKCLIALLSICAVFALAACDASGLGGHMINPPSWFIGTWSDSAKTITYTVTEHDIVSITSNTVVFSEAYSESPIKETIEASHYRLTDVYGSYFDFVLTNPTTINYTSHNPDSALTLTKQ
jgi:hypothetical protein